MCQTHRDTLFQKSYVIRTKSRCDMCLSVREQHRTLWGNLQNINIMTSFENSQVKNSCGKLICRDCHMEVSKKTNVTQLGFHSNTFECLLDSDLFCCGIDSRSNNEFDYVPPMACAVDEDKIQAQINALNNFLATCDGKKTVNIAASYQESSYRVKLRHINLRSFIPRSSTTLLPRNDLNTFVSDVCSHVNNKGPSIVLDETFRPMMGGLTEAYVNVESW